MTTPNNGGAAFPVPEIRVDGIGIREGWDGMTLRDYFAAKALPSCYDEYFAGLARGEYRCEPEWRDGVAIEAFRMADAMLAERSKS